MRKVTAHPHFTPFGILFRAAFLLATFATIIWALVRHAERSHNALDTACDSRLKNDSVGFDGDPDFYGLGIRLGVYLQWLSDLITTGYLEKERQYVLLTYQIFSISIVVALFVKIFTSTCTFSAEVFTVLVLFWGGYNIVQIPTMKAISRNKINKLYKKDPLNFEIPRSSRKLRWSMQLLTFVMYPVTIWFWARIPAAEGIDFASTPGGTAYFFFARIHGHALKPFGVFMAIASAINFTWSIYVLIPGPSWMIESRNDDGLLAFLIIIPWLLLYAIFWLPSLIFALLYNFLRSKVFTFFRRILRNPVKVSHESGITRVPTLESGKYGSPDFDLEDNLMEQVYLMITQSCKHSLMVKH